MGYMSRLDKAFKNAPVLSLYPHQKYVFMSDCHRATGNHNDNFMKNQNLFFAALNYYYDRNYTYIELGDGDELWENPNYRQIIDIHSDAFWILSEFYKKQRFYMLYGNHDMKKKNKCQIPLFPDLIVYEGLILEDCLTGRKLYLTHGHQPDFLNSVLWRVAAFLVRYVWKPLENIGIPDPTSAAKNNTLKNKTERRLMNWTQEHSPDILITGHTHRPVLPAFTDIPYFNTGSTIHPRCITGIELSDRQLTLIKWSVKTKADRTLYIGRDILAGPYSLDFDRSV